MCVLRLGIFGTFTSRKKVPYTILLGELLCETEKIGNLPGTQGLVVDTHVSESTVERVAAIGLTSAEHDGGVGICTEGV